jgi:flagellar hook-associated protein 1 FlgK
MSLLGIFDIGKSAIFASQTALNIAGHNIANVNTPGFSRQETVLEPASATVVGGNYIGRGVTTPDVRRHYDKFIQSQLLGQKQSYGRSLSLNEGLTYAEQIFNEAGEMGLSEALNDFFNAWNDVANSPDSHAERTVLLQKADTLAQRARTMEGGLEDLLGQTDEELSNVIDQVNSLARQIADVNDKILRAEAGGTMNANDLRDTRERLLGDLADLVEFNYVEAPDSMVTVIVGDKNLVDKRNFTPIEGARDASGGFNISMDGVEVGQDIVKGKLGGLLATGQVVAEQMFTPLRKLMASPVFAVNSQHSLGFDLNGEAGGFLPASRGRPGGGL